MAAHQLAISNELFDRLLVHCRAEYPHEACGIMTGRDGVVHRAFALRNVHPNPATRYEIDPTDQYAAMRDVLAGHEELVAIYHSHPTTAAYPSQTDINMAYYPEAFYVIISLSESPPKVQAFRIVQSRVSPVGIRLNDEPPGTWLDLR